MFSSSVQPGGHVSGGHARDDVAMRQLRHQTKNAMQRILCQITTCRDLQATPHGARLMSDLERRVRLSSVISDALFGVTSRPGPLDQRLTRLVEATVELLGDPDALIRTGVYVEPGCPAGTDETALRIVHEFVGNAVKHGLYSRCVGSITVRVTREKRAVRVQVLDDGWGFCSTPEPGEGMRLAALLAKDRGGAVAISRRGGLTVAEALLHPS